MKSESKDWFEREQQNSLYAQAQEAATKAAGWIKHERTLRAVKAMCCLMQPKPSTDYITPNYISLSWYNVQDMKIVEPIFEAFEPMGVQLDKWKSADTALKEFKEREFTASLDGITIVLHFFLGDDNCRIVEVGEEVVKKYKLECGPKPEVAPAEGASSEDIPF